MLHSLLRVGHSETERSKAARPVVPQQWLPLSVHKDFSYLYEEMSGRGESAVLSPGIAVARGRAR
jgi:hypothetical protein